MTETTANNEKLPPIHPGEILEEEFLRPMNITQYRLAKTIEVDARRVHAIVNGERGISAETALLFSRFFGNSAGFWIGTAEPVRPGGGGGAACREVEKGRESHSAA